MSQCRFKKPQKTVNLGEWSGDRIGFAAARGWWNIPDNRHGVRARSKQWLTVTKVLSAPRTGLQLDSKYLKTFEPKTRRFTAKTAVFRQCVELGKLLLYH